MDDQSVKLGFHLKHLTFKHREEMDVVEKKSRKEEWVISKGYSLDVFSKCLSGVWTVGHREFAESSSELLSLLCWKPTLSSHF